MGPVPIAARQHGPVLQPLLRGVEVAAGVVPKAVAVGASTPLAMASRPRLDTYLFIFNNKIFRYIYMIILYELYIGVYIVCTI